jgi:hypothetical protein
MLEYQPTPIEPEVLALIRNFVYTKFSSDPSNLGLDFFVVFVRDDLPIAIAQLPAAILLSDTVQTAVQAYNPSHVVVVFDGCYALTEINPISGEPWEPGEPDDVRLHHEGVIKGWIQEAAVISVFNRNGGQAHFLAEYRSTASGYTWMDQDEPTPADTGPHAHLSEIVSIPSLPLEVRDPGNKMGAGPDDPFYSPEMARLVIDIGATRILDSRLMLNGKGSMRFIAHSAEEAGLLTSQGLDSCQLVHFYS